MPQAVARHLGPVPHVGKPHGLHPGLEMLRGLEPRDDKRSGLPRVHVRLISFRVEILRRQSGLPRELARLRGLGVQQLKPHVVRVERVQQHLSGGQLSVERLMPLELVLRRSLDKPTLEEILMPQVQVSRRGSVPRLL